MALYEITENSLVPVDLTTFAARGVTPDSIMKFLPERTFLKVPGKCSPKEFRDKVSELRTPIGTKYSLRRFFTEDDELFFLDGVTYALSNQWSRYHLPALDKLISQYPEASISYTTASAGW